MGMVSGVGGVGGMGLGGMPQGSVGTAGIQTQGNAKSGAYSTNQ